VVYASGEIVSDAAWRSTTRLAEDERSPSASKMMVPVTILPLPGE
jgi:hypothetical protein